METEYFLIISPDSSTQAKLMDEKKRFAALYNCPAILHSRPHISLVKFFNTKENETRIIQYLQRKIAAFEPFIVDIEDFSSFPTHSIFAKVHTKKLIINIVKSIGQEKHKLKGASDKDVYCIMEPHITLARSLQHWQYEKGWLEWQHVRFAARFKVDEVLLLRKESNRLHYNKVSSFPLQGLKNEWQQASLF